MSGESRRDDPLVIRRIDYLGPMATPDGWRPEVRLPEIAFGGRSNVGKSSLINALTRRNRLARVSHTPGRTREIHFFNVNDQFALVDLPGYGYARISKARKAEWVPLIEGYLRASTKLAGVVQLLDARRDPNADDLQMLDFLADVGVPTLIAATKVDKVARAEQPKRVRALADAIGIDVEQVIPFSAETGQGRDELAAAIVELLELPSWRPEAPPEAPGEDDAREGTEAGTDGPAAGQADVERGGDGAGPDTAR
jgi:GTP-binding protein